MEHKNDLLLYTAEVHTVVNEHLHQHSQPPNPPRNPWGPGAWKALHQIKKKNEPKE